MLTKVRVVEEINRYGVPVKPDKIQGPATHDCGCLAREAVRIIHDDWRKVPKDDKDYIWQNWIKCFRVPVGTEPDVQKWVMKTANKAFKDWKSDLNMDYVQKGQSPFKKYGMITPDDWATFVEKKTSEAVKLLTKQRSERAKKNVHPHTMGSYGYADETLPWKNMNELRYNSLNLYRSNMMLNLRNLNYPLLLLLRHHNLHVRLLL